MLEFDAPQDGPGTSESRDYGAYGKTNGMGNTRHAAGLDDSQAPPVTSSQAFSNQYNGRKGVPPPAYPYKAQTRSQAHGQHNGGLSVGVPQSNFGQQYFGSSSKGASSYSRRPTSSNAIDSNAGMDRAQPLSS